MDHGIVQLEAGDSIPGVDLKQLVGAETSGDLAGRPIVLFFYLRDKSPTCTAQLTGYRDTWEQFQTLGALVIGVGVDPAESHRAIIQQMGLKFPLVSDPSAALARRFGAAQQLPNPANPGEVLVSIQRRTLIIDPNQRVAKVYAGFDPARNAHEVLADVKELFAAEAPRQIISHAPVLMVPNVLSPEVCSELIRIWETQGNEDSGFMRQVEGKTVGMLDYSHKIRRDHFLHEGPVRERLKPIIGNRVLPEMRKAFNYDVTRFEDFRIACYDAQKGGYFRPHRDNTTEGTAHRRFAMSLLLNDEYEGGCLRFPEYAMHTYRPRAGSAVIFSCSLLHEATDVTAGRRFVLLSFFYGEREAKAREEYSRKTGGRYQAGSE